MYEATLFDNCNEMIYTDRADDLHDAVRIAYRRMMIMHTDEETAATLNIDELRCTTPDDEGLEMGKPVPQCSGDFFVVYDADRMTTPLGFVRRIS